MMKKTLVALAAVAVTGGAFAQAVMTGSIGYAYVQSQTSAGVTSSGIGKDDASLMFAISEDIEGLGKLSSSMGIGLNTTDKATVGKDMSIKLDMGATGAIKLSSEMGTNYVSQGVGSVGSAAYASMAIGDTVSGVGVFSTRSYQDVISYKLPLSESLSVSAAHAENADGTTNTSGEGKGAAGYGNTGDYQRYNTYSVDYKAGALTLNAGYRTYDMAQNATGNKNTRNRAAAAYDLGVAKIGAAYEQTTYTYGNTLLDTLVAVSVPLGQVTLSAQWGNQTKAGNASSTSDTSYAGSMYNLSYALSKRTSVVGTYITNQSSGTSNPNATLIWLTHSF